jgi:type II secretory pathway component PulK
MRISTRNAYRCKKSVSQRGVAVIVVLALLAIILLYISANARTLYYLGREIKLIERQQIQRLAKPLPRTNSIPAINLKTGSQP